MSGGHLVLSSEMIHSRFYLFHSKKSEMTHSRFYLFHSKKSYIWMCLWIEQGNCSLRLQLPTEPQSHYQKFKRDSTRFAYMFLVWINTSRRHIGTPTGTFSFPFLNIFKNLNHECSGHDPDVAEIYGIVW
jgi:hypothetical protein